MSAKKVSPKNGNGHAHAPVIRIASLKNPKSGNTALIRVRGDGRLADKRDAQRVGVARVTAWREVEADTWAKATAVFRAGKGRKVSASK
jgi:hypothetical protein